MVPSERRVTRHPDPEAPEWQGDQAHRHLARRDTLDQVAAELAKKRRKRAVVRSFLVGLAATNLIAKLQHGVDPVKVVVLTIVILAIFLIPFELSWRPIIARLEGAAEGLGADDEKSPRS